MRMRSAGEDGETEGQNEEGENDQEEKVDPLIEEIPCLEGVRSSVAAAPSPRRIHTDIPNLVREPLLSHSAPFQQKRDLGLKPKSL